MAHQDGDFPDIVFKYRNWEDDDDSKKEFFGRRLLTHSEIFYPSPHQFNDPFDGALPFRFKKEQLTPENVLKKMIQVLTRNYPGKTEEEILTMSIENRDSIGFNSNRYWRDYHKKFIKTVNDTFGILSLTPNKDNLLMWSHYTKSHQGYCVGIDNKVLYKACECQIEWVNYEKIFPEIDMFDQNPIDLIKLICTKSEDWEYEDEIRILRYAPNSKIILPPQAIKQIILGCNMNTKAREAILEIKRKSFPQAELYETKINDEEFKLDFSLIN
jgi:Protein of unknown function (DUF2971)